MGRPALKGKRWPKLNVVLADPKTVWTSVMLTEWYGGQTRKLESTEKGGRTLDPNGYDAAKKIKGKKRYILGDTVGLVLHAIVHPADIEERDGGILLISALFGWFPFLRKLPKVPRARARGMAEDGVERTFAWLNRGRRLCKAFENLTRSALAFVRLASIRLMLRKLCNP